jgi:hypothetical protein
MDNSTDLNETNKLCRTFIGMNIKIPIHFGYLVTENHFLFRNLKQVHLIYITLCLKASDEGTVEFCQIHTMIVKFLRCKSVTLPHLEQSSTVNAQNQSTVLVP